MRVTFLRYEMARYRVARRNEPFAFSKRVRFLELKGEKGESKSACLFSAQILVSAGFHTETQHFGGDTTFWRNSPNPFELLAE